MDRLLLSRQARHTALTVTMVMLMFAITAVVQAAEPPQDEGWHFAVIPYIWLPSVSGSMNIGFPNGPLGGNANLNVSSSDYLSNLKFAGMLSLEVTKGDWSILADGLYVNFSDDNAKPIYLNGQANPVAIKVETKLKSSIVELAGAYRVYRNDWFDFGVLVGARYAGVDSSITLNLASPIPPYYLPLTVSQNRDLLDPIIGIKGRFELGKGWFIPYYADIGGFGVSSNLTWQAFGGVGYKFSDLFSMVLAYRHLQYNFGSSKLLKDMTLTGPELGFLFRF